MANAQSEQERIEEQRTKTALMLFIGGLLGVDQTYVGIDAQPVNPPNQYVMAVPGGGYVVVGQPAAAPAAGGSLSAAIPLLLIGGALLVAWLVFKG